MAHRRHSDNSGGGVMLLLVLVIGIIAYAGVAILIIGAVVGLIYLIVKVYSSRRSVPTTDENQASQQDTVAPQTKSIGTSAPQWNKQQEEIRALTAKYRIEKMALPKMPVDPLQQEMNAYVCVEVIQAVHRLINERKEKIEQLHTLKSEIDKILSCPGCKTDEERLNYLRENEPMLQGKQAQCATLRKEIETKKIQLLNKHDKAFSDVKEAIQKVSLCDKVIAVSEAAFKSFVKMHASIPGDLFDAATSSVELNFEAYRFFLLPEVILAFDKNGVFVTAFEPMAMILNSRDIQKSVYTSKAGYAGNWKHYNSLVSKDSVKVSEGPVTTHWRYEKKGGGPDLRYSDNPMSQNRTDTYRCGEITIQIGRYQAKYEFSSGTIASSVKRLGRGYTAIAHEPNATPSLLRLLALTGKKKDIAQDLSENYENANKNFFCRVG